MRDAKININSWESLTEDSKAWKSAVWSRVEGAESDRMEQLLQKRTKRKETSSSSNVTGFVLCPAPETATPALAYMATPGSATLELPCAAINFRDGRWQMTVMLLYNHLIYQNTNH